MLHYYDFLIGDTHSEIEALTILSKLQLDPYNGYSQNLIQAVILDIQNNKQCLHYYKLAIEDGDPISVIMFFFYCHQRKIGCPEVISQLCQLDGTISYFSPWYSEVKNALGVHYLSLEQYEIARKYFLEAFNNCSAAAVNLGIITENIDNDYQKAIAYYQMGRKGIPGVYEHIARCYMKLGDNINMMRYSAMEHSSDSLLCLANYCCRIKNYQEAIRCWLQATSLGNVMAMKCLAHYYHTIEHNKDSAFIYEKMAFDHGDKSVSYNLAVYYEDTLKDYHKAIQYQLIVDTKERLFNTALIYQRKLDDLDNAIKYYKLAVDRGCINANFNLANLYSNLGKYDLAIEYYQMAADKGYLSAWAPIASIYMKGKQYSKAIKCLQNIIKNKDGLACLDNQQLYIASLHNTALCYGRKKDYERAFDYAILAVSLNNGQTIGNIFLYLDSIALGEIWPYLYRILMLIRADIDDSNKRKINSGLVSFILRKEKKLNLKKNRVNMDNYLLVVTTLMSFPSNIFDSVDKSKIMMQMSKGEKWFDSILIKLKENSDKINSDGSKFFNEECPICLDDIKQGITLTCLHQYCCDCLLKHCKNSYCCPMCKSIML